MANSADGLDLHCLQRQGIFGFSRTRVKDYVSRVVCRMVRTRLIIRHHENNVYSIVYIVKRGCTVVYIIVIISAQNT